MIGQDPPVLSGNAFSGIPPNLQVELLMGISIYAPLRSVLNAGPPDLQHPHTLNDLPIWQILAATGKWDAAQQENFGRTAGFPVCGVTEVTERRKEMKP